MPYIGNQPYQGVIDSGNIVDGSIQTGDLANSAVTTAKIADSNITTTKIADTGVTVAKLNSDVTQLIAQGGGPKITGVAITDSSWTVLDDTAVDTAGGYIKLTGTNFVTGCSVVVGTMSATAVTFTSSTELRVQLPAQAAGTYILYVTNPDGGTAIRVNAVTYSATPSWVTSSTLPQQDDGVAISIQLSATSATTYALQAGSTLPSGLTLTSGGLLSGTVSGLASDTSYSFTVVATDAELQDSPRAFTVNIAATDTYFNLTTLLINGDTAPNVLTDASSNNFNLTAYGDARASNFTPYGTGWSNYFDGSSYLSISTSSSTLDFGTGDFTIEMWVNPLIQTTSYPTIISCASAWSAGAFYIRYSNTGAANKFGIYWNGVGDPFFVSSSTYPENTWHHVAVTRSGSTVTLWVNGASAGTGTSSASLNLALGSGVWIGNNASASCNYKGYISNIRVVKGVAVYTGTFTPPTSPLAATQSAGTNISAITGTQTSLLTCQSNRFIDSSTNNFTITRNGDARIVSFNPFNITNTGVNGSMYFDGSGDYVQIASSANLAVGAGDFTIECWVNTSTFSLDTYYRRIFTFGSDAANNLQLLFFDGTSAVSTVNVYSDTILINGTITVANGAWHHVAVCRSGTSLKLFVDGVQSGSTATTSQNFDSAATNGLYIGRHTLAGGHFLGFMSDFRVVKGTALYTTTFTPPTQSLAAIANTQLLTLQNKQPHNNHSFQDSSTNNHLITRSGNATQGTLSPFSQTGWGNYFGGSGNYLKVADGTALDLPGDFTLEGWFYFSSLSSNNGIIGYGSEAASQNGFSLYWAASSVNKLRIYSNGAALLTGTTTLSANTWNHIAIVRSGSGSNNLTVYVNGAVDQTATNTTSFTGVAVLGMGIGVNYDGTFYNPFTGYASNIRLVKGQALATGAFTPPTSPVSTSSVGWTGANAAASLTGTVSVLTCQSNRFVDNSSSPLAITVTGSPSVQAFSPFNPTSSWSAATNGGSGYFDGSGDTLVLPSSSNLAFGTGDFCVEAWVYWTATGVLDAIYGNIANSAGGDTQFNFQLTTTNKVQVTGWSTFFLTGATSVVSNTWNHIVVCRSGTTLSIFLNGTRDATTTSSNNWSSTNAFYIGDYPGGGAAFSGYISNLRVVKGSTPYDPTLTTLTVPTAPLTAITNTQLLLNFTNAGILDATGKNVLETVGDAKISTTQSKWGGSSMLFDGNGDYLFTPSSVDFVFNGDFTIEFWVYRAGSSAGGTGNYESLVATYNGSTGYGVWWLNTTNVLHTRVEGTTADTTTALSNSTWYHVAVTRSGSTVRTFVNGVQGSSLTSSATAANPGLYIGAQTVNKHFNGYIDDLRITKGYARYTANFTPPAQTFKLR